MCYFALPVTYKNTPTECQSALYCLYYFPSKDLIQYENLIVTLDFSSIFYFRKSNDKSKVWYLAISVLNLSTPNIYTKVEYLRQPFGTPI